jgi:UDP-N-acetylmuramoyl-L-alanyl-D-glutamate--2,6-diaminopimelate ligase
MTNKNNLNNLIEILAPYIVKTKGLLKDLTVYNTTNSLQLSARCDIVFYRLHHGDKAWNNFLRRYKSSNHGLLVLCGEPKNLENLERTLVIDEKDTLVCMSAILDILYPLKKGSIKLVGITGTNGKTTTAHLALKLTSLFGKKGLSVGTLGVFSSEGQMEEGSLTTPSFIDLRKIIYRYQKDFDVIFFEVSSHGLHQGRLSGLDLDLAAWTNFSQDHLDYHHSMENYFYCKTLIFKYLKNKQGKLFRPSSEKGLGERLKTFPVLPAKSLNDWNLLNLPPLFLEGFNRKNLELALQLNEALWGAFSEVDLLELETPKGRFSQIQFDEKLVVIDYAHTPDALENIIKELKGMHPKKRLGLIFGCGGDRDRKKRSLMGMAAARCVDQGKDNIYVTSDNPRTEEPLRIINDILVGLEGVPQVQSIMDRKEAIFKALSLMGKSDMLLIAGKGHENYQEIKGVRYPFCDFQIIAEFKKRGVR